MSPQFAMPSITPVVKRILIATFAIYGLQVLLGIVAEPAALTLSAWFSVNPAVWANYKAPALWQFVTYGFLHGGIGHVFWNMLQLYFFGTMLEAIIGSRRFVWFYLGAIALGGMLHLVSELIGGSYHPVIGASGGVMGVIVAAAILRPHTRVLLLFIPISLWVLAAGLVAIDFFSELQNWKSGTHSYVSHWAHLGGALFGGLLAWRGWIWIDWSERFTKRREEKHVERRQGEDVRLDALLAKVHRDGIQSLTNSEREFLNRMSKRH